eukprot:1538387-Rhodomonas_salina.4
MAPLIDENIVPADQIVGFGWYGPMLEYMYSGKCDGAVIGKTEYQTHVLGQAVAFPVCTDPRDPLNQADCQDPTMEPEIIESASPRLPLSRPPPSLSLFLCLYPSFSLVLPLSPSLPFSRSPFSLSPSLPLPLSPPASPPADLAPPAAPPASLARAAEAAGERLSHVGTPHAGGRTCDCALARVG